MNLLLWIIVIVIIIGLYFIQGFYNRNSYIVRMKKGDEMNLKPGLDLTGLSIITFNNGDTKINALIDTGSNTSHVITDANIDIELTDETDSILGVTGEKVNCKIGIAKFNHNNQEFEIPVRIGTMDAAFKQLKADTGVSLQMIIGSDFLTKYNKVLDYKNLIIHTAK